MLDQIMAIFILATIFGGIALVLGVIFWGAKITGRRSGKVTMQEREEETRIIQEIYQGLSRMEERVDTLETLLLEKKRMGQQSKEADDA